MPHPVQALLRRHSPHRLAACAVAACLVLAGTVSAGAGWMLHDARRAAWYAAEQAALQAGVSDVAFQPFAGVTMGFTDPRRIDLSRVQHLDGLR